MSERKERNQMNNNHVLKIWIRKEYFAINTNCVLYIKRNDAKNETFYLQSFWRNRRGYWVRSVTSFGRKTSNLQLIVHVANKPTQWKIDLIWKPQHLGLQKRGRGPTLRVQNLREKLVFLEIAYKFCTNGSLCASVYICKIFRSLRNKIKFRWVFFVTVKKLLTMLKNGDS